MLRGYWIVLLVLCSVGCLPRGRRDPMLDSGNLPDLFVVDGSAEPMVETGSEVSTTEVFAEAAQEVGVDATAMDVLPDASLMDGPSAEIAEVGVDADVVDAEDVVDVMRSDAGCLPVALRPLANIPPLVTASTTLSCSNLWLLQDRTVVQPGVVLRLTAGTVVLATRQSAQLIVRATGRLEAEGTRDEPVVFSARETGGPILPGAWVGILLLGNARMNNPFPVVPYSLLPNSAELGAGGEDDTANCGTLRYVRVEFAGARIGAEDTDALAMVGCGSRTTFDSVQVLRSYGDGLKILGGTFDLRHLVVHENDDDCFSWRYGWRGRGQYIILRAKSMTTADDGISALSNASDPTAMPRSEVTLANVTVIGGRPQPPSTDIDRQVGIRLGTGVQLRVFNSILAHNVNTGILVENLDSVRAGTADLRGSVLFDNGFPMMRPYATTELEMIFADPMRLNRAGVDPRLVRPMDSRNPDFSPQADSPVLMGAAVPPMDGFFEQTTFVGALPTQSANLDWTAGWTSYRSF